MLLPNLDYAFLAEYAKVEANGTLTSIGASFTRISAVSTPVGQFMSVAGRVRVAEAALSCPLAITFIGAGGSPEVKVETTVSPGTSVPYRGRVGVLFAVNTVVPIVEHGLHHVTITLDGQEVRQLSYEVERPTSA